MRESRSRGIPRLVLYHLANGACDGVIEEVDKRIPEIANTIGETEGTIRAALNQLYKLGEIGVQDGQVHRERAAQISGVSDGS
jgi:predicted transcriptional regulator